jgi:hypothetical protein
MRSSLLAPGTLVLALSAPAARAQSPALATKFDSTRDTIFARVAGSAQAARNKDHPKECSDPTHP